MISFHNILLLPTGWTFLFWRFVCLNLRNSWISLNLFAWYMNLSAWNARIGKFIHKGICGCYKLEVGGMIFCFLLNFCWDLGFLIYVLPLPPFFLNFLGNFLSSLYCQTPLLKWNLFLVFFFKEHILTLASYSFFFKSIFYFIQLLKVILHLQLLQNNRLYAPCCTVHPWVYLIPSSLHLPFSHPYVAPSSLPTGNHWFVHFICASVSLLYLLVCCIF